LFPLACFSFWWAGGGANHFER